MKDKIPYFVRNDIIKVGAFGAKMHIITLRVNKEESYQALFFSVNSQAIYEFK